MPLVRPPPETTASPSQTTAPPSKPKTQFAACKRTAYQTKLRDWFHITSPTPFPNFDICPDCYNTSIKPTSYARFISPAPPRPDNVGIRCDFSDLWVRIAFAWLYIQNVPDLTLIGRVAELQDPEGLCPNLDQENEEVKKGEKKADTRTWYCLQDPKTGQLIEDLTICSHCVSHINLIMPCLRGIFGMAVGGQKVLATCDLMNVGHATGRFLKYIDQFTDVAESTLKTGTRDISPLTEYVKKWALVPVCRKWEVVKGEKCWSMSSVVPEFTVCEECYLEHIQPLYSAFASPQPSILLQLTSSPVAPPNGFKCQLYSPRLQQYFKDACSTNDLQTLRQKIIQRNQKFQEVRTKLDHMRAQYEQQKMQMNMQLEMMRMERTNAMTRSLAWTVSGWGAAPVRRYVSPVFPLGCG